MTAFTIELDEASSVELRNAAAQRQTSAESLIAAAAEYYLAEQGAQFNFSAEDAEAVREGIAQLDRGEGIPHERVVAELRAKFIG